MKLRFLIAMILVACLALTRSYAQKPELVKDINNFTSLNSGIIFGANIGNVTIFSANDGINGQEPWRTDGTSAGTFMLKDVLSTGIGNGLESDVSFAVLNGEVYFSTSTRDLYKTDGTVNGTVLLSSTTGKCLFEFGYTVLNNVLYFSATGTNNRRQPWRTDGTPAGTYRVKDIPSSSAGSSPSGFTSYNGQVYFTAGSTANGRELWKTDGTDEGTIVVKDIIPGTQGSDAGGMSVLNGWLYFTASDPTTGRELWRTDGSDAGTTLVKDIRAGTNGSSPGILYQAGNQLLFVADDGINGQELWKSDGTEAGTQLLKDILPGAPSGQPTAIVAVNNLLYFRIAAAGFNIQLWRSDGTTDGTIELLSTTAGSSSSMGSFVTQGSKLYFLAKTNANPGQLWTSDGTPAGTVAIGTDVFPASTTATSTLSLWAAGNGGLLANHSALPYGNEPWICTLLPGGFSLVKDINTTNAGSAPTLLTRMGNNVYFRAADGVNGTTLWKTDGTEAGTTMVVPPGQGTIPLTPGNLFPAGTILYFSASTAATGNELWKTDGTIAGTSIVKDINGGTGNSNPQQFCLINGTLYFQANVSGQGAELWQSDGTAAGTIPLKDIATGSSSGQPRNLVNVNGTLFFSANNNTAGASNFELWKSDGTDAGTVRVKDILVGTGGSNPENLTAFGNQLLFSASNGTSNGIELWRSDGTDAGTIMVKDINPGAPGSGPQFFYVHDGLLYFAANDGTSGIELWRSDGTNAGTTLVRNINAGSSASSPRNFASLGNVLLFDAFTSTLGTEPWKTDGTNAGTVLVKDVYPGFNNYTSTTPAPRVVAGSKMYFSGSFSATEDGILGFTDGTADATGKTDPMANGTVLRNILGMAALDNMIIFDAFTIQNGQELYKYPLVSTPALLTWTGNVDTEWANANNWSPVGLPGPGTEIIIPASMPRYPLVQASSIIKKLTVAPGASLQLANGTVLTVLQ